MTRYRKTHIDDGTTFQSVSLTWHIEIDTDQTPDCEKVQAYSDWVDGGVLTTDEAARIVSVLSEFQPIHPRKR